MLQEFKNFAIKGNVMDLAVGVIIGAAFGSVLGIFGAFFLLSGLGMMWRSSRHTNPALRSDGLWAGLPGVLLGLMQFAKHATPTPIMRKYGQEVSMRRTPTAAANTVSKWTGNARASAPSEAAVSERFGIPMDSISRASPALHRRDRER